MGADCVFCNIVSGVIPANVVRADDEFIAFHDVEPRADVHVLVIPRQHHRQLDEFVDDVPPGLAGRMLRFVSEAARDLGVDGRYRLVTNVGPSGGQVVFHLHWHIMAGKRIPGF